MNEIAHPVPGAGGLSGVERRPATSPPTDVRRPWRGAAGWRRAAGLLAALAVAAVAAAVAYRAFTRPQPVRIGSAEVATVREQISGPGTVQSRYAVSIGTRVAGTIDRVLVDVGEEVQPGQLLATLDRTELEARLGAARGALRAAQRDVALADANLEKARADLDLADTRDRRARGLLARGVISVAEADEARGALKAARAGERAARAGIEEREAARARVSEEQRIAETVLSYTELRSPMGGVVTRRALEPGSAVAPGAVLLQVVDPDALWVATLIDQSLAGRVALGQRAVIRLRSGAELGGHVARIAFEADPVTRELEIDVAFDKRPSRFAIHEEADVTILGQEARGLAVPLEALTHGPGGTSVFVVEDGRARHRQVRLGVSGARQALVIEGLASGEPVILTPRAARDGQRVAAAGGGR